jgi:nicotinamidase/pyrazinamidase
MVTVALIAVDVQNDFTESGPFSLLGHDAIARAIGSYVARHRHHYDLVITTQDWHVEPGGHFLKHPVHCVAGTVGAALDPELDVGAGTPFDDLVDRHLYKGQFGDDYSGFSAVRLAALAGP